MAFRRPAASSRESNGPTSRRVFSCRLLSTSTFFLLSPLPRRSALLFSPRPPHTPSFVRPALSSAPSSLPSPVVGCQPARHRPPRRAHHGRCPRTGRKPWWRARGRGILRPLASLPSYLAPLPHVPAFGASPSKPARRGRAASRASQSGQGGEGQPGVAAFACSTNHLPSLLERGPIADPSSFPLPCCPSPPPPPIAPSRLNSPAASPRRPFR